MANQIKCLFGYHTYTIPSKKDAGVLICEVCKRASRRDWSDGEVSWYTLSADEKTIYFRNSFGCEGQFLNTDRYFEEAWRNSQSGPVV